MSRSEFSQQYQLPPEVIIQNINIVLGQNGFSRVPYDGYGGNVLMRNAIPDAQYLTFFVHEQTLTIQAWYVTLSGREIPLTGVRGFLWKSQYRNLILGMLASVDGIYNV